MFSHLDKDGQGIVEYALIIFLVFLVVVLSLTLFGEQIANLYQNVTAGF